MLNNSPNFEVDQPIINDAYEEPARHWQIRKGEKPTLVEKRRAASYFFRPARLQPGIPPGGLPLKLEEVNRIRDERKRWRADGYPGATSVTRELLDYWERPERDRKIIFAQREAAEAIIFLKEAPMQYKQGLVIKRDDPNPGDGPESYHGFERLCVKMATGSGKTTVMGLIAAWSILNHRADPKNKTYSETILVLCPNSRSAAGSRSWTRSSARAASIGSATSSIRIEWRIWRAGRSSSRIGTRFNRMRATKSAA